MSRHFYPPNLENADQAPLRVPRRAYGQLDHTEPALDVTSESVLFAFDAVDAEQLERVTHLGTTLDLDDPAKAERFWAEFWKRVLAGMPPPPGDDPFEQIDLFRIETVLDRDTSVYRQMDALVRVSGATDAAAAPPWIEFTLGAGCQVPVEVFPRMFGPPLPSFANFKPTPAQRAHSLEATFSIDYLPRADTVDIAAALGPSGSGEALAVYDVGQGGACALIDDQARPWLNFDIGCGVYRNARTRPEALKFCTCGRVQPPPTETISTLVVLSHWDADHWAGVFADPQNFVFLGGTWIVPYQGKNPGVPHLAFAYDILRSNGRLLLYDPPRGHIDTVPLRNGRTLHLVRAHGQDRNDSGFVLCVDDAPPQERSWLLTGDAAYVWFLDDLGGRVYETVVVPHHGANIGAQGPVPKPYQGGRRLVFSFGANNAHGRNARTHPTPTAVATHAAVGWDVEGWRGVAAPGHREGRADIRGTNKNGPGCERLESVFVEWGLPGRQGFLICGGLSCTPRLIQT